jgi:hypothetical protein
MYPSEGGSGAFLPLLPYQKRVLKELIRRIEAAIRNPDEDVGHIPSFARLFSPSILYMALVIRRQIYIIYSDLINGHVERAMPTYLC